jgi:hypothetical protein
MQKLKQVTLLIACGIFLFSNAAAAELDEARVREIVKEELTKGWLPSMKGVEFKLGLVLETEWNWAEHSGSDEEKDLGGGETVDLSTLHDNSYIAIDKAALYLKARYGDSVHFRIDIEGDEGKDFEVDEFHLKFELPQGMLFDFGLDERMWKDGGFGNEFGMKEYKFSRHTETYPLTGCSVYRDEQYKLTLGYVQKEVPVYGMIWVGNGLDLGSRNIMGGNDDGNNDSNKILQDDNFSDMDNQTTEAGVALGFKLEPVKDILRFNALASYAWSRADTDDLEVLSTLLDDFDDNDDEKTRWFGRLQFWLFNNWELVGEYVIFEDGKLERDAWMAQTSYKLKNPHPVKLGNSKLFTAFTPVVRYAAYNVDQDELLKAARNPLTWSRQQWTFSWVAELVKHIELRFEYNKNTEDDTYFGNKDVGEIDNDEFITNLKIKF